MLISKKLAIYAKFQKKFLFIWHGIFATSVTLTNGVTIETVRKSLVVKTTQHYFISLDKKVSEDRMVLRDKLSIKV
jgi:hypothetical protein